MGPLFVSISSINSLPPMLVPFLMPSAFRWKHVKLLVPEQSLEEELVPLQPLLSGMEALEINLSSLSPVSIFKNSLQLRELSTEALSSLSHFSCADNAFSIRRLVLSGTRLAEGDTFGQILSSYTRVEEMFVRWFIPTVPENLPAPIKMPHLRHLELYRVPDGTLEQTIKHMTAPSLQSLSVTIHQSRFDGQDLDDLLKRSRCSLHYLDLDIQGSSEPVLQPYHMIKLLEQCQRLEMLVLEDERSRTAEEIIHRIRSDMKFLPKLGALCLIDEPGLLVGINRGSLKDLRPNLKVFLTPRNGLKSLVDRVRIQPA